jgi:hypothetical protein
MDTGAAHTEQRGHQGDSLTLVHQDQGHQASIKPSLRGSAHQLPGLLVSASSCAFVPESIAQKDPPVATELRQDRCPPAWRSPGQGHPAAI